MLLFGVYKHVKRQKYRAVLTMVLFFLSLLCTYVAQGMSTVLMIIIRFPIYIVGFWIGFEYVQDNKTDLNNNYQTYIEPVYVNIALHIISFIIITCSGLLLGNLLMKETSQFLADTGLFWYPFCFSVPFIAFVLAELLHFISIKRILNYMGKYSLEIYMIHYIILCDVVRPLMGTNNKSGIISMLFAIGIAPIFRACIYGPINRIRSIRSKKSDVSLVKGGWKRRII